MGGIAPGPQQLNLAVDGAQHCGRQIEGVDRKRIAVREGLAEHPACDCEYVAAIGHHTHAPALSYLTSPLVLPDLLHGRILRKLTHSSPLVTLLADGNNASTPDNTGLIKRAFYTAAYFVCGRQECIY